MARLKAEQRRDAAKKLKNPTPVELPSGKYRCQVTVNGQRASVVEEDPAVAHAKALAIKANLLQAEKLPKDRITIGEAIDNYIATRDNILSPVTIKGYEDIKRKRLQSLIGKRVCDVTPADVQAAVNQDARTVGYKTIKNALALFIPAIRQYRKFDDSYIKLPQRIRRPPRFLDECGMIELFEAIQGAFAEIPILLAVWLGMRRSEIMGLCWDCVDFEKQKISIQRAYVKARNKGYTLRKFTKNESSRRVLDCPGYILAKLEALQPDPAKRSGQIFKMHPNTVYSNMKRICERHGIDFVGVHGLRHTNASVMLSLGIVDKVAMARGGWSTDVTMKQVYQHIFTADKSAADRKIDSYFSAISEGKNPKLHTQLHT